jgi:hypothetical protein
MLKKFNTKLAPVSYIKNDICIQVGKNIKTRLLTKF